MGPCHAIRVNEARSNLHLSLFHLISLSAIYMYLDRNKIVDKNLEKGISWCAYMISMVLILCLIDIFMVRDVSTRVIYFQF